MISEKETGMQNDFWGIFKEVIFNKEKGKMEMLGIFGTI